MVANIATLDLTQQRLKLTPALVGGADEVWTQDALIKSMALEGLLDVSFESDEPTNIRKLWYDRGAPPTGNAGVLKRYDEDLEEWVALTPATYRDYVLTVGRQRWFFTSEFEVGQVRPADDEVLIGDYWEHDTGNDNELSIYRQLSPDNYAWVDLTGGTFDEDALIVDGGTP